MSDFTRGILYAGGMYVFGKCCYKLGRIHERKEIAKVLVPACEKLEKKIKEAKEESKEA